MTALLILIALFAGFILGMLVGPFWNWYYRRKANRAYEAWALKHHRLTEDQFLRLVNERKP